MDGSIFQTISPLLMNLRAIRRTSGTKTALAYVGAIALELPEIVRRRNLIAADRRMCTRRWPYLVQGVALELSGEFFGLARDLYCRQVYFPSPAFALQPGTVAVDLGSNVGLFSILAALAGCRVLAVEAQLGFVEDLRAMSVSYGVAHLVDVENALVGAGSGLFSAPAAVTTGSHSQGQVPAKTSMTELMAKHAIGGIDFLKVDIEGSEFELFRDSDGWLPRVKRIAMEVHPQFGSVDRLCQDIRVHGLVLSLTDDRLRPVERLKRGAGYLFAHRPNT